MVLPIVLVSEVVRLLPWWRVIIRCGGHETKVDGLGGWWVGWLAVVVYLGGGFEDFLFSPRKLGKVPNLTIIFFKGVETTN